MSLDVYLQMPAEETCMCGCACKYASLKEVYSSNITHNLNKMAVAAGIYQHIWRPEELGITNAGQLIEPLTAGVSLLKSDPTRFETYNSPNGWGMYEHFVPFVEKYLQACEKYPEAQIYVSR